jgi:hypothetical protein
VLLPTPNPRGKCSLAVAAIETRLKQKQAPPPRRKENQLQKLHEDKSGAKATSLHLPRLVKSLSAEHPCKPKAKPRCLPRLVSPGPARRPSPAQQQRSRNLRDSAAPTKEKSVTMGVVPRSPKELPPKVLLANSSYQTQVRPLATSLARRRKPAVFS